MGFHNRISEHAQKRCQQRGVSQSVVDTLLKYHDVEFDIGDDCRLLKVSRLAANDQAIDRQTAERLPGLAIIWSDRTNRVVTVMHVSDGRTGRRFRRQY